MRQLLTPNNGGEFFTGGKYNRKRKKLFSSPRWNEYQNVKVLKTYVKPTEEDKKKVEEFRRFIDEQVKKNKDKKSKNDYQQI